MAYKEITNKNSPNFTPGRAGKKIDGIVIHWWNDPKTNPTAEGVVNWLCNPVSQVSAHFVVTGTRRRVWQLVNDRDTAWHAGNSNANQTKIGIELDPRCRKEDYSVAAELIADLRRYYGNLPLTPHSKYTATSCPGNWNLSKLDKMAKDIINPPKPKPTPKPTPAPKPTPPVAGMPNYSEANNKLLKQILALLQGLVNKIGKVFK